MTHKKSKFQTTTLRFQHDIIIHSVAGGLPTDGTILIGGLIKLGYDLLPQQQNPSIQTVRKSNTTISINTQASVLSIEPRHLDDVTYAVNDVYDVLEHVCMFDVNKYPVIHQFNGAMTLRNNTNPSKTIDKIFSNKKGVNIINSIFDISFHNTGVKLSSGDPFGQEYFRLIIEPKISSADSEYYINITYRNSLEKTQDFVETLSVRIDTLLEKLSI